MWVCLKIRDPKIQWFLIISPIQMVILEYTQYTPFPTNPFHPAALDHVSCDLSHTAQQTFFRYPPFDEIHGSSGSHPMHGIHRWKRRRMAGSVPHCGPQGPGLLHQGPGQHDFGRSDERPRQPLFAAHQNLPKRFGGSGSSGRRISEDVAF